jgi:enamine deaminase RidA (YjgF/YER057c/UK114 family)
MDTCPHPLASSVPDRIHSASSHGSRYGFCRVLGTGYRIIVAGTAPIGADGSSVAASAYAQTQRCIAIMLDSLSPLGGSASDVAQTRMFITDPSDDDIGRAHGEAFAAAPLVVVAGLLAPRWRIEMEREAICAQ